MTIPVLKTERLRLRGYQASDLAPLLAMWQQPQFYRYITGQPAAESDVWPRMLRDTGLWAVCGFGYWAIEEKATGEYVGAVGFADFRRDMAPSLGEWPEVGWSLAPTRTAGATLPKPCKQPWLGAMCSCRCPVRCASFTLITSLHYAWLPGWDTRSLGARTLRASPWCCSSVSSPRHSPKPSRPLA
jgi:hypothetical protein